MKRIRKSFILIFLILSIIPEYAFAQREELQNIEKLLLEQDDFEASKEIAEKILRDGNNTNEDLSKLYLYLGIIYGAENQREKATNYFERALLLDPTLMIPLNYAPKITMPFREARNLIQIPLNMQINYQRRIQSGQTPEIEINILGSQIEVVNKLKVYYREDQGQYFSEEADVGGMDTIKVSLPIKGGNETKMIDFFVVAYDEYGNKLLSKGRQNEPMKIAYEKSGQDIDESEIVEKNIDATEVDENIEVSETNNPEASEGTPFYKTWWFWTVIGVVAVGTGVGVTLAITKPFDGGDPNADDTF